MSGTELWEWNMIESKVVKEWQERGRRESSLDSLLAVLKKKFGTLPEDVPLHLTAIDDASVLRQLLLKAIDVGSFAEFQREIPNGTK